MKALVIGGAGFIGSHLADKLIKHWHFLHKIEILLLFLYLLLFEQTGQIIAFFIF